jgi:hypothetical protein
MVQLPAALELLSSQRALFVILTLRSGRKVIVSECAASDDWIDCKGPWFAGSVNRGEIETATAYCGEADQAAVIELVGQKVFARVLRSLHGEGKRDEVR